MAYTYKVETMYDNRIPQTALLNFKPTGIAMHWTAGGTGWQGAIDTRQFFMDTAAQRNASYHCLVYWEESTRTFGIIWIVAPTIAAHSIAPQPASIGGSYDPNAEVQRILGVKVKDPNAGCLAVSFCGMPADLDAALNDPDVVLGFKKLIGELTVIPSMVVNPLFNHGWAQPTTRYDAGDRLIPLIYGEVPTTIPVEDDMLFWQPVQQDWTTFDGTVFYDGAGNKKFFTDVETVRSIAESSDGRWRLVKYGDGELLMVDARTSRKEGPGLAPIDGTRVPVSGFGFPPPETTTVEVVKEVPTGITQEEVNAAHADGVSDGTDAEKSRLRTLLGL